jgi:pimeloyl-ACP methyl ester carboxylesterase
VARLIAALAESGALAPARALVRLVSRGGLGRSDEALLAPVSKLPPEVRAGLSRFWVTPKFFEALGSQIGSIRESAAETERAGVESLAQLPLTVISAATSSPRRLALNGTLARTSARGRHVVARHGGHWVPLDDPDVIVDEIGRMLRG